VAHYRKSFIVLFLALITGLLISTARADHGPEYCGPTNVKFAHCPGAVQNFKTLVLTIHGWKGDCKTTFGEDEESLYSLLDRGRFFDWDCFHYDSESLRIEENVKRLRKQIAGLKRLGYEDVMIITHSTGGILALHLLVDRFVDPAGKPFSSESLAPGTRPNKMSIPAIVPWTTPINGLRWAWTLGENALNFFGATQETLPDLDSGSEYLRTLKTRLRGFDQYYQSQPAQIQRTMKTNIYFYQGQKDDFVVKGINRNDAISEGWLWSPSRGKLINIEQGHISNIGNPGAPEAHKYPAEIVELRGLLELPIKPNLTEVFPERLPAYAVSLEPRQLIVVNGLTHYAERNFRYAIVPALAFLRRMLLDSFPRSKKVDNDLIDGLLKVFERELTDPVVANHGYVVQFVNEVLGRYNPSGGGDLQSVGHRSNSFVQKVLKLVKKIDEVLKGRQIVAPTLMVPSVMTTQTEVARLKLAMTLAKFLESSHGPVQFAAIDTLQERVNSYSGKIIKDADLVSKMATYYESKSNKLTAIPKQLISSFFVKLVGRKGDIGKTALEALNKNVSFSGKKVPMWKSFQDKAVTINLFALQDRELNEGRWWETGSTQRTMLEPWIRFNTNTMRYVGVHGNDSSAARTGAEFRNIILEAVPSTLKSQWLNKYPLTGEDLKKYPGLSKEFGMR